MPESVSENLANNGDRETLHRSIRQTDFPSTNRKNKCLLSQPVESAELSRSRSVDCLQTVIDHRERDKEDEEERRCQSEQRQGSQQEEGLQEGDKVYE